MKVKVGDEVGFKFAGIVETGTVMEINNKERTPYAIKTDRDYIHKVRQEDLRDVPKKVIEVYEPEVVEEKPKPKRKKRTTKKK